MTSTNGKSLYDEENDSAVFIWMPIKTDNVDLRSEVEYKLLKKVVCILRKFYECQN